MPPREFTLNSYSRWFKKIQSGEKKAEARLWNSVSHMNANDMILFRCYDKFVRARILSVHHYLTFEYMLRNEPYASIVPGVPSFVDAMRFSAASTGSKDQTEGAGLIKFQLWTHGASWT